MYDVRRHMWPSKELSVIHVVTDTTKHENGLAVGD